MLDTESDRVSSLVWAEADGDNVSEGVARFVKVTVSVGDADTSSLALCDREELSVTVVDCDAEVESD